jgi:hypothetical protein
MIIIPTKRGSTMLKKKKKGKPVLGSAGKLNARKVEVRRTVEVEVDIAVDVDSIIKEVKADDDELSMIGTILKAAFDRGENVIRITLPFAYDPADEEDEEDEE